MENIVNFLKTSSIFFIGSMLSKVIIFVLLPVYTKYLETDEYGYFDVSNTYITIITWIVFLEISPVIVKFMLKNEELKWRQEVISSCAIVFSVSLMIYVTGGIVLHMAANIPYLWYIFFYGLTNVIRGNFESYSRGYGDNIGFAIGGLINTIVTAFLNVTMIIYLHCGVISLYIAPCIGNILQIFFLNSRRNYISSLMKLPKNNILAKEIAGFGIPTTINLAIYWILTGYGIIVISKYLDLSQNGLYAVGTKFGAVVNLVTMCLLFAWQNLSFRREKRNGNGLFYAYACKGYLLFLSLGVFILLPVCRFLFQYLVDDSYLGAYFIIPSSILVAIAGAYESFVANIFYAEMKAKYVVFPLVIAAILNLFIMPMLTCEYGIQGVNYSILIAFITCIILMHIIAKFYLGIKFNYLLLFFVVTEFIAYTIVILNGNVTQLIIVTSILIVLTISFLINWYKKFSSIIDT